MALVVVYENQKSFIYPIENKNKLLDSSLLISMLDITCERVLNLTDIECAKSEHEITCALHIMQGLGDTIPHDHDNVLDLLDYFMYDNISDVKIESKELNDEGAF